MTAPGNNFLVLALTLGILLSSAYAIGRIHQWDRYGSERDEAYRLGYDKASLSIIEIMNAEDVKDGKAAVALQSEARSLVHGRGRHARGRSLASGE